jgi:hypothetical protein
MTMLPGPDKLDCPCGCGKFGTPRRKAWGDGLRHVSRCPCPRCVGGRQSGKARRRENKVAKDLGGHRHALSGGLSGADVSAGYWSFEETSNEAIVRGFRRWWTSKGVRSKLARLFARRGEAHALVLSWDGRPQVVVTPYEDFVAHFPHQSTDGPGGAA